MNFFGLFYINDWLILLALLGYAVYRYYIWNFEYWADQGVPGPSPYKVPFSPSYMKVFKEGFRMDKRLHDQYGDTVGLYEGRVPTLLTQDDEFLREVLVKQFHNFTNRRDFPFPEGSGIEKGIFSLRDDSGWKDARDLLSPVFSSGKLKKMTKRVNDCARHSLKSVGDLPPNGKVFNMKTMFSELAMNFIATVAYGLDLKDTNSIQEFSSMGRKISEQFSSTWKMILLLTLPGLTKILQEKFNITIFDLTGLIFFRKVVDQILESRTKGDTSRNDLIQAMANAHNETVDKETIDEAQKLGEDISASCSTKQLTRDDILGHGVLFFSAGFDTVSTSLSFLFYELALHPECQDKVYAEAAQLFATKDDLTFDDQQGLKYLDCCYSEALRLHPVVLRIDREAKDEITIKGIKIQKRGVVNVPIGALHMDEKRWPNPQQFRPERFTEEEKKDRSPFSWMPFGYGPRHCIGMRLALMEAKLAAAHIIYNFKFEPCATTQIPYVSHPIGIVSGEGLDINIIPRMK